MEKLKEELENMNDLMEQKDTLTQKLEVSHSGIHKKKKTVISDLITPTAH